MQHLSKTLTTHHIEKKEFYFIN